MRDDAANPPGNCGPQVTPPADTMSDPDWLAETVRCPPAVIRGYSAAIAACIVNGSIPLTDRQRLVRRGVRLGLTRFEANLVIAAVQHRARNRIAGLASAGTSSAEFSAAFVAPTAFLRSGSVMRWLAVAVFIEAVALAAAIAWLAAR